MSTNFDHLVAFVSDQAVDAVSVLFDPSFHFSQVTLLSLARDMHKVPSISKVIEHRLGVPVTTCTLPNPHIPEQFCGAIEYLLKQLTGQLAINLNTDDAVCACLALQAAARVKAPVFAIETQSDRLVWLSEPERSMPPANVADTLRCLDVFEMHGFEYIRANPVGDYATRLACAQGLMALAIQDETLLPRFLPKTGLTPRPLPDASDLIPILRSAGLLNRSYSGKWQFNGHEAVSFLRGTWLEFAVYDAVALLAKDIGIVDSHRSLAVRHRTSEFTCEFDIVFMLNNNLHIIECKSGDSRGAKFLTHFEGIARVHGLRARTMLVSVDRLSDTLVAAAQGMRIAQIHGPQLAELSGRLAAWMRDG